MVIVYHPSLLYQHVMHPYNAPKTKNRDVYPSGILYQHVNPQAHNLPAAAPVAEQ